MKSKAGVEFTIRGHTVEAVLSARTRAIIVCNPNNPTGNLFDEDDMVDIIEAVAEMYLAGIIRQDGIVDGSLSARSDRMIATGRTASYVLWRGAQELTDCRLANRHTFGQAALAFCQIGGAFAHPCHEAFVVGRAVAAEALLAPAACRRAQRPRHLPCARRQSRRRP